MTREDKKKSPVQIDLAAKAEAKIGLQATVPSSSMGRFVDALTDLFRPTSEARGLKADLIKLQREEVAIKIARLAKERASIDEVPLVPPPLKVLIPLFEIASQEDIADDFIIDVWSKLLVSACSPETISPRFISLIGEMNSRQARLFLDVMEKDDPKDFDDFILFEFQQSQIEEEIGRLLANDSLTAEKALEQFKRYFECNGVAMDDVLIDDDADMHVVPIQEHRYGNDTRLDLEVLRSIGLLHYVDIWYRPVGHTIKLFNVRYYIATPMGAKFYEAISGKTRIRQKS